VTRARVRVELTSGRWRIHNRFPHADWSIVDLWLARQLLGMHVSSAQEEAILRLGSPEFPRITATAFGSYPCRSFSITSVRDIGLLARELSLCRDLFIGALIDLRSLAHTRLLFILVSRTSLSNRIVGSISSPL
jgi:hypothetical protein